MDQSERVLLASTINPCLEVEHPRDGAKKPTRTLLSHILDYGIANISQDDNISDAFEMRLRGLTNLEHHSQGHIQHYNTTTAQPAPLAQPQRLT